MDSDRWVSVPLRGLEVFEHADCDGVKYTAGEGFRPLTGIRGLRTPDVRSLDGDVLHSFRPLTGIRGLRTQIQI